MSRTTSTLLGGEGSWALPGDVPSLELDRSALSEKKITVLD
jgi:hypothetical protein